MAEANHDACSESSVHPTCPGLEYDENESLSARNALMVNNRWLSDVTFIVGPEKQRIYAHKLRLVTASKYFHALFFGNFAEARLDEIELKEEDPEMFLTILRLIYGAHVDIDTDNIRAIYDRMQLYLLPHSCYKPLIDCLTNLLSKDTVMKVWRENDYPKFKIVDERCLRYIRDDPLYCFKNDDFTLISKEGMQKIVGLQRINCTNDQLREALEKWKIANAETDSEEVESVMDGTLRMYSCEKICTVPCGSINLMDWCGVFSLLATHEPVALHGISVCVKLESSKTSDTVLVLKGNWKSSNSILTKVQLSQREKSCFEVVDLMFEKIVLRSKTSYKFSLDWENCTIVGCKSYFSVQDETIKISPITADLAPAIFNVWANPLEQADVNTKQMANFTTGSKTHPFFR